MDPLRLLVFAIAATASLLARAADAPDSAPYFLNDPAKWGRASRIVTPDYPKEAVERRMTGFVDVTGRINWAGVMEEIEYAPDTPQSGIFVKAVSEVIPDWRFRVVAGDDCLPSDKRVTARVWFEFDGEKPKISVSQLPADRRGEQPEFNVVHRVDPIYPRAMQRNGWQAYVFARLEIDAQGSVTSVTTSAYPKQRRVNLELFENAVVESLGRWKFAPARAGRKANRVACFDVHFRLRD